VANSVNQVAVVDLETANLNRRDAMAPPDESTIRFIQPQLEVICRSVSASSEFCMDGYQFGGSPSD